MAELVHEDGIDITKLFSSNFLCNVTDTIADLVSETSNHVVLLFLYTVILLSFVYTVVLQ